MKVPVVRLHVWSSEIAAAVLGLFLSEAQQTGRPQNLTLIE